MHCITYDFTHRPVLTPRQKRRFTASDGTVWAAEVRAVPDVVLAFSRGGTDSVGRRTFLYFSSSQGHRRVETFPAAWATLSDHEMEALLLTAHQAPK